MTDQQEPNAVFEIVIPRDLVPEGFHDALVDSLPDDAVMTYREEAPEETP